MGNIEIGKIELCRGMAKVAAYELGALVAFLAGWLTRIAAMPIVGNLPHPVKEYIYDEKDSEKPWTRYSTLVSILTNITIATYATYTAYQFTPNEDISTGILGYASVEGLVRLGLINTSKNNDEGRPYGIEGTCPYRQWSPGNPIGTLLSAPFVFIKVYGDHLATSAKKIWEEEKLHETGSEGDKNDKHK